MDIKKIALYGGGALAVLAIGYLVLVPKQAASDVSGVSDLGYSPPVSIGAGGGSSGGVGTGSTDTSVAQMIAAQLQTAQLQSTTTLQTAQLEHSTALAQFANNLSLSQLASNSSLRLQQLVGAQANQNSANNLRLQQEKDRTTIFNTLLSKVQSFKLVSGQHITVGGGGFPNIQLGMTMTTPPQTLHMVA